MKCQKCQERPATVHLTEIEGSTKKEVHLCEPCASSDGESAGGGILEKLQSLLAPGLGRAGGDLGKLTCTTCGTTYAAFRARGRFGCADCYEAFRRGVEPLLERIHGGVRHVGKAPGGRQGAAPPSAPPGDTRLRELRADLETAVAAEEYERAAALRDAIRKEEEARGPR